MLTFANDDTLTRNMKCHYCIPAIGINLVAGLLSPSNKIIPNIIPNKNVSNLFSAGTSTTNSTVTSKEHSSSPSNSVFPLMLTATNPLGSVHVSSYPIEKIIAKEKYQHTGEKSSKSLRKLVKSQSNNETSNPKTSYLPSISPSAEPSYVSSSARTVEPTELPDNSQPTSKPSLSPTTSAFPSSVPSKLPTGSAIPSLAPSLLPSTDATSSATTVEGPTELSNTL
mmetsp:Transcript_21610/g.32712  ORF Transcript_21610/g.32712 Transcript_21610/m.32712 type:complete len:225 (+) Transcript_21610:450-1124(+)